MNLTLILFKSTMSDIFSVKISGYDVQQFFFAHYLELSMLTDSLTKFPVAIIWGVVIYLLSFLNGLSYRYQIGLKWKVFWSSF